MFNAHMGSPPTEQGSQNSKIETGVGMATIEGALSELLEGEAYNPLIPKNVSAW